MATPASADGQVHRLVDMEVQEVSLVDRAANKRRFLVVKRSEGMGDKGGSESVVGDAPGEGGADGASDDGADTGGSSNVDGAGSLVIACDALEGLTRAVEQLQGAGADSGKVLGDVVQELRAAADLLQEQLGAGGEGTADSGDAPTSADASTAGRLDSLLAVVGELVTEIRASRKATKSPVDADDEDEDDPASGGKSKGKTTKAVATESQVPDLGVMQTDLRKIGSLVEQQTRRLERLEKRSGVPSSQPAGERPARALGAVSDDVSWPLDLNNPPIR